MHFLRQNYSSSELTSWCKQMSFYDIFRGPGHERKQTGTCSGVRKGGKAVGQSQFGFSPLWKWRKSGFYPGVGFFTSGLCCACVMQAGHLWTQLEAQALEKEMSSINTSHVFILASICWLGNIACQVSFHQVSGRPWIKKLCHSPPAWVFVPSCSVVVLFHPHQPQHKIWQAYTLLEPQAAA